jgi:signal transduction histidine kinase
MRKFYQPMTLISMLPVLLSAATLELVNADFEDTHDEAGSGDGISAWIEENESYVHIYDKGLQWYPLETQMGYLSDYEGAAINRDINYCWRIGDRFDLSLAATEPGWRVDSGNDAFRIQLRQTDDTVLWDSGAINLDGTLSGIPGRLEWGSKNRLFNFKIDASSFTNGVPGSQINLRIARDAGVVFVDDISLAVNHPNPIIHYSLYQRGNPRFPSANRTPPPAKWSCWWPTRIRQLENERKHLLESILALPQHELRIRTDHLGYHSLFVKPESDDAPQFNQLSISFPFRPHLDSIAFAPALDVEKIDAYAFPKRFRVELRGTEGDRFETVVDWTEEDFPDPGPYPIFFADISRDVESMRITFPQVPRECGMSYYALGEIYLFQRRPGGGIGSNILTLGEEHVHISAPDSLELQPLWDSRYLYDGIDIFGLPLASKATGPKDLFISYEDSRPLSENVQILLDLGMERKIGRIDFWPAATPYNIALPSFGFPEDLSVELSNAPDFKSARLLKPDKSYNYLMGYSLLTVVGEGAYARYIRVTMNKLATFNGRRILALGEIRVSSAGKVWSSGCVVDAKGIPNEYLSHLPRLVDGYCQERRILTQGEWIRGLAQRQPLDQYLEHVESELELTRNEWRRISEITGPALGIVILLGLATALHVQRRIRRRDLEKMRLSIARDLHDDVGSSLGCISLAADQLQHSDLPAEERDALFDISLMSREAWASLHDMVWISDESTIRLLVLVEKLVERARRVLGGVEVIADIAEDVPECLVSLTFRRHLIIFFKEVLHNCARHSCASRMWMDFSIEDKNLRAGVHDNGRGFDPSTVKEGLGLGSMRNRAVEMGGELEIESSPGGGVSLVLRIPLAALESKVNHSYGTSN